MIGMSIRKISFDMSEIKVLEISQLRRVFVACVKGIGITKDNEIACEDDETFVCFGAENAINFSHKAIVESFAQWM